MTEPTTTRSRWVEAWRRTPLADKAAFGVAAFSAVYIFIHLVAAAMR